MPGIKQLLIQQTIDAFSGRRDMSIMSALEGITQAQASWRASDMMPTAEQLVRHVAWAKSKYCRDGFGTPMVIDDSSVDDNGDTPGIPWEFPCGAGFAVTQVPEIAGAVALLDKAQAVVMDCLERSTEQSLEQAVPGRHGKSATHLFWVLLMHDAYHAGQIRTRRAACDAAHAKAHR